MRQAYAESLDLIAELASRDIAVEVGYPNLAAVLRDVLRITPAEARRRLTHASAVTESPLVSGGVTAASLPATAAAVRGGVLGADHVDVITRTLSDIPLHVPDADRELAEHTLVEAAQSMDARTLTKVGHRVRAWLHEDGTPPSDQELAEPVNELHLHTRANGRLSLRGDFDPEASALITTALSPLAKPRPTSATGPDPRSPAERNGDALVELIQLAAGTGDLPSEAGEKPHLLVTVPLETLRTSTNHARNGPTVPDRIGDTTLAGTGLAARVDTGHPALAGTRPTARPGEGTPTDDSSGRVDIDGVAPAANGPAPPDGLGHIGGYGTGHAILDGIGPIDAASARRIACDAKVIPVVLGSRSEPLDLGRATYTVPTALRRALILRDGGCAFPGCDRTYRWCHGHHIRHGLTADQRTCTMWCCCAAGITA